MKKFSTSFILCLTLTLTACSQKPPKTENVTPKVTNQTIKPQGTTKSTPPVVKTENKPNSSVRKVFTLDELKKYNGENGTAAYVAIDGVVYDVTKMINGKMENIKDGLLVKIYQQL